MNIHDLLDHEGAHIIDEAISSVERAHLRGYQESGTELTRERLTRLFLLTKDSVRQRNLTKLLDAAREIARERSRSGFDLREVQTAFNALEEAIWYRILNEVDPENLAEALGLVSTALGAGKDQLARVFVEEASGQRPTTLDVRGLYSGRS